MLLPVTVLPIHLHPFVAALLPVCVYHEVEGEDVCYKNVVKQVSGDHMEDVCILMCGSIHK